MRINLNSILFRTASLVLLIVCAIACNDGPCICEPDNPDEPDGPEDPYEGVEQSVAVTHAVFDEWYLWHKDLPTLDLKSYSKSWDLIDDLRTGYDAVREWSYSIPLDLYRSYYEHDLYRSRGIE